MDCPGVAMCRRLVSIDNDLISPGADLNEPLDYPIRVMVVGRAR